MNAQGSVHADTQCCLIHVSDNEVVVQRQTFDGKENHCTGCQCGVDSRTVIM